jgi:hypothetical protein
MIKLNRALVAAATTVLGATSAMAAGMTLKSNNSQSITVKVEQLHPFTHFVNIPDGADLPSIKFQGVKKVKVATQRKSTTDPGYCEDQQFRDPGGSMYCPDTQLESPSGAYQVTYSYHGQPLASDEYGNTYFTFSVFFRPEELSPALREALAKHRISKAAAAAYFALNTYRAPMRQVVIDEAASIFCGGDFVKGGLWTHTDPKCEDKITYRTITARSDYITVKVDPSSSALEETASR